MACGRVAGGREHRGRALGPGRDGRSRAHVLASSRSSRALPFSSCATVAAATVAAPDARVDARVDRPVRLARAARQRGDQRLALLAQALAAARRRVSSPGATARRRRRAARRVGGAGAADRGRRRRRRRPAEQPELVAGLRGQQQVVEAAGRRQRVEAGVLALARARAGSARLGAGSPASSGSSAWRRSSSTVAASCLSRGSDGRNTQLICSPRPGRAADEAPDDLAEEQLRPRGGGVDADAQARDVDALGDHQHRHEPRLPRRGERGDPPRGVRVVGGDDRRPRAGQPLAAASASCSACSLSAAITSPPASGCSPARSSPSRRSASRSTCGDPVALRVQRRAQPPRRLGRGQDDGEVGVAAAAVGHPLHVAVVGAERDGAADAVVQRLRVGVGVVGARDAVVVVGDPRDRGVVASGTACRTAAASAGPPRTPRRRVVPQAACSPMWCGSSAISSVGHRARAAAVHGRAGGDGLVGDGDAVAVARLRAPRRWGGWARGRCRSAPRRPPTGGRCGSSARRPRPAARAPADEHPVRDVQPEGRLARRGRRGGQERLALVALERAPWPRPATRAAGRSAGQGGSGRERAAEGGEDRHEAEQADKRDRRNGARIPVRPHRAGRAVRPPRLRCPARWTRP